MKRIIFLVIYISGCVWCYMDAKREWVNTLKKIDPSYVYTIDHINPNIMISTLSWVGVIFFEFKYHIYDKLDKNTPAKW